MKPSNFEKLGGKLLDDAYELMKMTKLETTKDVELWIVVWL